MGSIGKIARGTHFEEIEYLADEFFAIDPYCLVLVFCLSPKVPTGKFIFYRPMNFFKKSAATGLRGLDSISSLTLKLVS